MTSVHFLKKKLAAGTSNHGFEVIDIETLQTQTLVDPPVSPATLLFLNRRPLKCIAVYCAGDEFLLCYGGQFFYFPVAVESDIDHFRMRCLCRQDWSAISTSSFVLGSTDRSHW